MASYGLEVLSFVYPGLEMVYIFKYRHLVMEKCTRTQRGRKEGQKLANMMSLQSLASRSKVTHCLLTYIVS